MRIAPAEAAVTGWAFGQGIYFADMFEKSWHYTESQVANENAPKYMLLCEVALGKMYEVYQFQSELKHLPGT